MKYNILQFSFGDGYAGSAKMAILSSSALIQKGHKVRLVVSKDSLTKKRAEEKGIPVIEINSNQKTSSLVKEILGQLGNEKSNFAVAYHSLDRKVVMKLKSNWKKNIISVAYRQNMSLSTPLIGPLIYNKYFDFMIACGQGVAQSLINEGIKKNKVYIVHNTTEIPENIQVITGESIRNKLGLKDKIVLGISSWFHKERKGFDVLFDSFSKLDGRFVLLIIGIPKENQEEVYEFALTYGITKDNITMPGFVDNIFEYYKAMDIFLLPSRSEGFSLALLEAAASGIPIIASNIPGNDEFINHKKNGLLFDIDKPDELTQDILQFTNKPDFRVKLGVAGRETFLQNFTLVRYTEKLEKFFDETYASMKK